MFCLSVMLAIHMFGGDHHVWCTILKYPLMLLLEANAVSAMGFLSQGVELGAISALIGLRSFSRLHCYPW